MNGTLDEAIHDLVLSVGDFTTHGHGRLTLVNGRLTLRLFVKEQVPAKAIGHCFAEDMPGIQGTLSNGLALRSDRIVFPSWTQTDGSPYVSYIGHTASVVLKSNLSSAPERLQHSFDFRAFVPAVGGGQLFSMKSIRHDDNPFFGSWNAGIDWHLYENDSMKIPIRDMGNGAWALRLIPKGATEETVETAKRKCRKFLDALGIVCGQQLRPNAFYFENADSATTELRRPHRPLGIVALPVPPGCERNLLKAAADYLLGLDDNSPILPCLGAFWNSQANYWPLDHLLLASATEGLAKALLPGKMCARTRFTTVAAELGIEISDEEFASWKKLRDALAHGSYAELESARETAPHGDRIISIFNQILLAKLGYTGKYRDYGQHGWPVANFAPKRHDKPTIGERP